ncbi:F-box protein At-B [Zea mays]|uniref:F-box protein At-B n=1 Tax=Zea mays TaxID=4577 RepID=A0A1D6JVP8_MAIZE|nr:F-box protein At-B [Zea mays]
MEVTIAEKKPRAADDGGGLVERLPEALLVEVLARVDVDGACSAAASCRSLYSAANVVLLALTSIDLSGFDSVARPPQAFAPSNAILSRILAGNGAIHSLTVNCSLLDDSAASVIARGSLRDLLLLKCSFSMSFFVALALRPNTIVLSRLSGSGKTTIYYQKEKVKLVHVIDVPGHARLKPKLDEVLPKVATVVFVVDAQDFLSSMQAAAE